MIYNVTDEKTIEEVSFRAFGSSEAVKQIFDFKPEYSYLPRQLTAGMTLILPDVQPAPKEVRTTKLWD